MVLLLLACNLPGPLARIGSDEAWLLPMGGAGADDAWAVDSDGEGGAWVTADLGNPTQTDIFLYRVDRDGEVLQQQRWNGGSSDRARRVTRDGDTLWVGGSRLQGGDPEDSEAWLQRLDARLPRFDNQPFATWDSAHARDEVTGIAPLADGVVAAGRGGTVADPDVVITRYDDAGEPVAAATWGGDGWDEANGRIVVADEHVYVAGRVDGEGADSGGDAFVGAFWLADLAEHWSLQWGEDGMEDALGMTTDGESLFVVGTQPGEEGVFVLSVDPIGALHWHATYDSGADESARAIAYDATDNSVVVAANTEGDVVMLRFDADDGDLLDTQRWWAVGTAVAHDLVIDGDRAWVVGQTDATEGGEQDAYLLAAGLRPWSFPLLP